MKKGFKINEVLEILATMRAILNIELPFKLHLKINRIYKKLQPEAEAFEEARHKKLLEYGKKTPDGKRLEVPKDKQERFFAELNEAAGMTVEIEFDPLSPDDFDQDAKIKGTYVNVLEKFFQE